MNLLNKAPSPKLRAGWAQPLELGAKMQGAGRGGDWEPLRLSATCAERAQDGRKLVLSPTPPKLSGILAETFHFGEFSRLRNFLGNFFL